MIKRSSGAAALQPKAQGFWRERRMPGRPLLAICGSQGIRLQGTHSRPSPASISPPRRRRRRRCTPQADPTTVLLGGDLHCPLVGLGTYKLSSADGVATALERETQPRLAPTARERILPGVHTAPPLHPPVQWATGWSTVPRFTTTRRWWERA